MKPSIHPLIPPFIHLPNRTSYLHGWILQNALSCEIPSYLTMWPICLFYMPSACIHSSWPFMCPRKAIIWNTNVAKVIIWNTNVVKRNNKSLSLHLLRLCQQDFYAPIVYEPEMSKKECIHAKLNSFMIRDATMRPFPNWTQFTKGPSFVFEVSVFEPCNAYMFFPR